MNKQERYELYTYCVGPGWCSILDKYIPQLLKLDPDAELYIKEKFGLLRLDARSETINWTAFTEMKHAAELESETTCECCGAPGRLRINDGWQETLCDRCNSADKDAKEKIIGETEKQWWAMP